MSSGFDRGASDEPALARPPSKRPSPQPGHMLPERSRLRDYEITGLIGEGGFGIVYLAWDHSLQRKVAIKEYMPASIASRVGGSSAIVVKSERHAETFRAGLKSFVNEARLLARFDHPSLVKVYRFWEENSTAYMAMPFYEGPTLKAALVELGRAPSEAELRAWLRPLLDALAVMHAAQCYHRDIAPDNILLTPAGPLLLDFGAARRVIGDMTHALTVVLKPGFAPIEQYGDVATMAQGAWTDLYALACVVYYAITGQTPTSSVERLMDDRMQPLSAAAAGRYSPAFLNAIDAALAVRPQDRPQNEREFRVLLGADPIGSPPPPTRPATSQPEPGAFPATHREADATVPGTLMPVLPTRVMAPAQEPPWSEPAPLEPEPETADESTAPHASPPSRWGFVAAGLLLAIALGAAFVWTLRGIGRPAPAMGIASAPAAVTTVAPAVSVEPPPSAAAPVATVASSPSLPLETPAAATITEAAPARDAPPTAAVARPRREPKTEATPRTEAPVLAPPATRRGSGARCSDILQRGSLEPLTAEEAAYLKRECR